ncbi:hypothetical protein RMATCC62417_13145 [Rhizopus microsporus]|nr:hypothetical protein RMATCC62417_13145 [Rhizopus microsporus]
MASEQTAKTVEGYFETRLGVREDKVLVEALRSSQEAGLPSQNVSFLHGRLLQVLALSTSAKRILEVGTLGGFSSIHFGRAVLANALGNPGSAKVITCERNPKHANIAKKNIENAGLSSIVEIKVGAALDTLDDLIAKKEPAFDLVFIDADKDNNVNYFNRAIQLSRPGTLIVTDNVVFGGRFLDENAQNEPHFRGVRDFNDFITKDDRVVATALQTVSFGRHDGLAFCYVK